MSARVPSAAHQRRLSLLLALVLTGGSGAACNGPVDPIGAALADLQSTAEGLLTEAGKQGQVVAATAAASVGLALDNSMGTQPTPASSS